MAAKFNLTYARFLSQSGKNPVSENFQNDPASPDLTGV